MFNGSQMVLSLGCDDIALQLRMAPRGAVDLDKERKRDTNRKSWGRLARRPTYFLILNGALQGAPKLHGYVELSLSIRR